MRTSRILASVGAVAVAISLAACNAASGDVAGFPASQPVLSPSISVSPSLPATGIWEVVDALYDGDPEDIRVLRTPVLKKGWQLKYKYDCTSKPTRQESLAPFSVNVAPPGASHGDTLVWGESPSKAWTTAKPLHGAEAGEYELHIMGSGCKFSLRFDKQYLQKPYTGSTPELVDNAAKDVLVPELVEMVGTQRFEIPAVKAGWALNWSYACAGKPGSFTIQLQGYSGYSVHEENMAGEDLLRDSGDKSREITITGSDHCTWTAVVAAQ